MRIHVWTVPAVNELINVPIVTAIRSMSIERFEVDLGKWHEGFTIFEIESRAPVFP